MFRPPNSIPLTKISRNLLLADPSLRDGIFNKSVVYMFEHDKERGSAGFILNHHTGRTVGELVEDEELKHLSNIPVYYGGPVREQQLHFVNFMWEENGLVVDTQVSPEDAIILHHTGDSYLRAFVGHSAWGKDQLDNELDNEAWFTAAPPRDLMDKAQDNSLWNYVLSRLSPYHLIVSLTPEDPFLN